MGTFGSAMGKLLLGVVPDQLGGVVTVMVAHLCGALWLLLLSSLNSYSSITLAVGGIFFTSSPSWTAHTLLIRDSFPPSETASHQLAHLPPTTCHLACHHGFFSPQKFCSRACPCTQWICPSDTAGASGGHSRLLSADLLPVVHSSACRTE